MSAYSGDGDIPFDEEAYNNTIIPLILYVEGKNRTASDSRELIFSWFNTGKYIDFIPYFDTEKIYKVMPTSPPKFTSMYYMGEGLSVDVTLTVKPYKYYIPDTDLVLTAPLTVRNTTVTPSLPRLKVYGTGNITLNFNGVLFVMEGVVDHIVLDSELGIAYNESSAVLLNANNKVFTRKYPVLNPGANAISWAGTVTSIEIEPRWRTLI